MTRVRNLARRVWRAVGAYGCITAIILAGVFFCIIGSCAAYTR